MAFEFTTARGAKITLDNTGKALTVQINGGAPQFCRLENDKALGLVLTTDRKDDVRKIVQKITIPVPAEAVAGVEQFRLPEIAYSEDMRFVDRLNAEMNRRNSKL